MRDLILFSGMGGATEGLVRAGWAPSVCVDGWDAACVAHRRWHPGLDVVQARIEDADMLLDADFRFIWASPSCKPWSTANRTPSRGKQHREYYSLARLVKQAFEDWRARWLVIENVGGLIWSKEGVVEIAELRAEVARFGLALSMPRNGCIPSNTLGVAQLRRRVFLIVGPRLVSIRPGSVLLPPAGVGPMLWETERADYAVIGINERTRQSSGFQRAERPVLADHGRDPAKDYAWARAGAGVVANEWGRVNGAARLRARRGIDDASPASRHANWNRIPVGSGAVMACEGEKGSWAAPFRGRAEAAVGAAKPTMDADKIAGRAERAVEVGEHPGRLRTRDGKYQSTGRTLAECATLQQIPMEPLAGFSKRVAHELVGNCVPPPVAEHIGRIVLAAEAQEVTRA